MDDGAEIDEVDEIEDERETREESDTIDSGEDAVETELASDERRVTQLIGEDIPDGGHLSVDCTAIVIDAWAIARPIDELLLRSEGPVPAAGVPSPLAWGVKRGVGRRPTAGTR